MELPRISGSQIYFPEGVVDINACSIGLLVTLFGKYMVAVGAESNQADFIGSLGVVKAFLDFGRQVNPESEVLGLDLVLDDEVELQELMQFYALNPKFLVLPPDNDYVAVFSPNFSVELIMPRKTVQVLSWLNSQHVASCKCQGCAGIRKIYPEIQGRLGSAGRRLDS
jgi:hypothetical protein